ncbi:hypothetical protein ABPG72_015350 [Tetrahymena utriculariae]
MDSSKKAISQWTFNELSPPVANFKYQSSKNNIIQAKESNQEPQHFINDQYGLHFIEIDACNQSKEFLQKFYNNIIPRDLAGRRLEHWYIMFRFAEYKYPERPTLCLDFLQNNKVYLSLFDDVSRVDKYCQIRQTPGHWVKDMSLRSGTLLSFEQVMGKITNYIDSSPEYDLYKFNCQHFCEGLFELFKPYSK